MPLRISLVSQSYLPYHGGITEHVWHLSAELAARGHRVAILTGRPLRPRPSADPDPPGVAVVRVGRTVRVPSNGARACVTCAWRGRPEDALRRVLGGDPDIVHIQSPLEPCLPLWALRNLGGLKVGTFHTAGERPHWGYRTCAPLLAAFARRLDHRIAVSATAARYVARHFPGDYEIIPNGIDPVRFAPTGEERKADGRLGLLYVGRLDPRKGLPTLLDALEGLAPRAHLTIVGTGPAGRTLRSRVRARSLPVTFRGALSRSELPACYRAADIFVAPSTDGESFGISLLEALASGRPVVAADIAGYRETLGQTRAGLLYPPGDAATLRRTLRELAGDPERRAAMGRTGRRVAQCYGWDHVTDRIEGVYQALLAEQVRARHHRLSRSISAKPRSVSASSTS